MSKARGVTMPRAFVPYIRRFATATTSPRARFVLMHGQVWNLLGQRPAGMRLGRAKGCYKNVTNAVLDCPAWRYVEGYAHHRLGVMSELRRPLRQMLGRPSVAGWNDHVCPRSGRGRAAAPGHRQVGRPRRR